MDIIDVQGLSVEPIPEDMQGTYGSEWREQPEFPPVHPPGKVAALVVSAVNGIEEFGSANEWIKASLNFGIPEGRTIITFQELMPWKRRNTGSSEIDDLLNVCGYKEAPKTHAEIGDRIASILKDQIPFGGQVDWLADCKSCRDAVLFESTGSTTTEEGWDFVSNMDDADAKKEIYTAVRKSRQKSRSFKFFPQHGGEYVDRMNCPECAAEIKAKTYIRRFLAP